MTGIEIAQLMDELHRIHRQIVDINYRERKLKRSVALGQEQVNVARKELESKRDAKQIALLDANEKEREAARVAQELERRREQLNLAKSDREFEALKIQIQLEERKNDSLADLTLEALAAVDAIDEEIKSAELKIREAEGVLNKAKDSHDQNAPKLAADLEHTRQRLREAESKLPRGLSGIYSRCVSDFGGEDALAPLSSGGYCGSCNCQIPIETVMDVCSGSAICCSACGRLLYMPEGYRLQ
ncbi:MAG: hypothetical protein IK077_09375 [Thermoguttaceae bacterium]|nr:hypothetical protein [Thermoguttaceae bacterium]